RRRRSIPRPFCRRLPNGCLRNLPGDWSFVWRPARRTEERFRPGRRAETWHTSNTRQRRPYVCRLSHGHRHQCIPFGCGRDQIGTPRKGSTSSRDFSTCLKTRKKLPPRIFVISFSRNCRFKRCSVILTRSSSFSKLGINLS